MSNFGAKLLVLHHQNFEFLDVVNENLSKFVGQHVPRRLVRTVPDVGHLVHPFEAPSDPVVDSLGFAPVPLHLAISVTLVSGEYFRPFFDDLGVGSWCDGHGFTNPKKIYMSDLKIDCKMPDGRT